MVKNITNAFIGDLFNLSRSNFSEDTIHQAKRCLIDYLGAAMAGSRLIGAKGHNLIEHLGSGDHSCKVIGYDKKVSLQSATFYNGFISHLAEMDDGYRYGAVHPGATVISALLPLAQKEGLSGNDVIRGIITGYEAALRISKTMQPALKNRGYHATGVCGTIGAAIGVAAMLGFSSKEMKNALSSAATGATGILKVIREGSQLKPLNAAQAASTGLLAAIVARVGFDGPEDVLGGDKGFLEIKSIDYNEAYLLRSESDSPAIHDIYVKPYAACRHCHPAIEAVLKINAAGSFKASDIKEILITTYSWAVHMHDHVKISGVNSAKMSTPYSVAIAIIDNEAGIDQFTSHRINDPVVVELTKKVKVVSNDEITSQVPDKRAAIVDVFTYDGVCYNERVDLPKGEPENPISDIELKEKFLRLSTFGGKGYDESQNIIHIVMNLEQRFNELVLQF
ncbi:MAG: MmgE/PrpD family protein [Bacteroidales bacterium]